jgi:hypothetical protein
MMNLIEDLESIRSEADLSDGDLNVLVQDEHERYQFYIRVSAVAPPPDDETLLSVILRDPDRAMREAATVELVRQRAQRHSSYQSFAHWVESISDIVGDHAFLRRRIQESSKLKWVMEHGDIELDSLLESSDWFQRNLSEVADSAQTLNKLAEFGRTKRIRNAAKQRLGKLHT